jgi:DNA-binding NarL/FixJ family response regulator
VRKSILLVDDNPTFRRLTCNHLEAHNLEVCGEASDGIDAVEKALELLPDLIVMDLSMPRKNGLEAARELKEKMPCVPIILFTGYHNDVRVSDTIEAGISAVISKLEPQKLLPQVLNLLEQRSQTASATVLRVI